MESKYSEANGRTGWTLIHPEGTKFPLADHTVRFRGKVSGHDVYEVTPRVGVTVVIDDHHCGQPIVGCDKVATEGQCTLLVCDEGAMWQTYGYKNRTDRVYTLAGGRVREAKAEEVLDGRGDDLPVIVSRHPGAVDFIHSMHPEWQGAKVVENATFIDVNGKHVVGNVPLHLAADAAMVTAIEFDGRLPIGADYGVEEMVAAGAKLRSYRVCLLMKDGDR